MNIADRIRREGPIPFDVYMKTQAEPTVGEAEPESTNEHR
jgi:hypothetical protein